MYKITEIQVAEATLSYIKHYEQVRDDDYATSDFEAVVHSSIIDGLNKELSDYILEQANASQ